MSKTYLVLYDTQTTISEYQTGNVLKAAGPRNKKIYALAMEAFTDPQEAADFATKRNGFIVIPAQVSSTIKEVA